MMLQHGWVLEKYWGWSVCEEEASLKLLRKRRGPLTTFLLLTRSALDDIVADAARRYGLLGPLSITVWNDFSAVSYRETGAIAGVRLKRSLGDRWFGVGTFVIDLSPPEGTLFGRIAARERTKCGQAARRGVRMEFPDQPSESALDGFLRLYEGMARERGLERPDRSSLARAWEQGDLLMARCLDSAGRDLVTNLIYLRSPHAYFLLGAREREIPSGAGHLAQWETVRRLKTAGFRWYDLGLVRSCDPEDGIYRFKKSLGGEFVSFGHEFQHVPRGLAVAYRTFRGLRGRLRRT